MKALASVIKKRLENFFGVTINRVSYTPPVDYRGTQVHPGALLYRSRMACGLFDADLQFGRGLLGYPLKPMVGHPFVDALVEARGQPQDQARQTIESHLRSFYEKFQPENAAQYLGLNEQNHPELASAPAWAYVFPWVSQTLEQRVSQKRKAPQKMKSQKKEDLPVSMGWKNCGPASDVLIENEAERLAYVMRSVEENGVLRHDGEGGDILASALVNDDGQWRWHIGSGQHRAAAMAALGHTKVAVRVNSIVYRRDVDSWPQVINGTYSKAGALSLFDKVFEGVSDSR